MSMPLTWDESNLLNETMARCLGIRVHRLTIDSELQTIWRGPWQLSYYSLFVPQFDDGWKNIRLLVRGMDNIGYVRFCLSKVERGCWQAAFTCDIGPCKRHGTTINNGHGSINVYGRKPSQAALFAALKAVQTGKRIALEPEAPHRKTIIKFEEFDWDKINAIIDHYQVPFACGSIK